MGGVRGRYNHCIHVRQSQKKSIYYRKTATRAPHPPTEESDQEVFLGGITV